MQMGKAYEVKKIRDYRFGSPLNCGSRNMINENGIYIINNFIYFILPYRYFFSTAINGQNIAIIFNL
jgi:hypothetical protein